VSAEIQYNRNPYSRHCYNQTLQRLRSAADDGEITYINYVTMMVVAEFHDLSQGGAGHQISSYLSLSNDLWRGAVTISN
jgi:hypothetical protein